MRIVAGTALVGEVANLFRTIDAERTRADRAEKRAPSGGTFTSSSPEGAFSEALKEELAMGKYTSWAEDLTAEQLKIVLWAVGEFACRGIEIMHPRQVAALQILVRMRRRELKTIEEAHALIRAAHD